jgi:hypothetical protein
MTHFKTPLDALKHHVTGAIERGERVAIVEQKATHTNKDTYAATYAQAFADSYPQLPVEQSKGLIEKVMKTALQDIKAVNIDGAAFKLTSKRLGIKHTYKAIQDYLSA